MRSIIHYEWLQIRRNKVSFILLIAVILLLILTLMTSWNYYNWYTKLANEASRNAQNHWDTQGEKNSHSAVHFGIYLFKPLSPRAIWDSGIDKYYGVSLFIEGHVRNQLQFRAIEDNPLTARWGDLTPAAVLLTLFPLLIIWLAGNSIVGDRLNGTLKMAVMQGISAQKYVWAKALTLWLIAVSMIGAIWLGGGLMASVLTGEAFFNLSFFLLFVLYVVYAGIFIHLGLFVSIKAKSRREALISALAIWLIVTLIIPQIVVRWSEAKYPAPTTEHFLQKIRDDVAVNGLNAHGVAGDRLKLLEKEWLEKYRVDSLQQLPLNWLGVVLQADEDINNPIFDRHFDTLYSDYYNQLKLHQISGWSSPLMPARLVSMSLSGTDFNNSVHFYNATELYRKDLIRKLNDHLRDHSRYGGRDTGRAEYWKSFADFNYVPPAEVSKIRQSQWQFFTIILWLIITAALLQWSATSYSLLRSI